MRDHVLLADLETKIRDLKSMTNLTWSFAFDQLASNDRNPVSDQDADTLLFALANLQDRAHEVEQ
ncbi:MAG: hypothetical protein RLO18_24380, partial [Gimesia chilikensis]